MLHRYRGRPGMVKNLREMRKKVLTLGGGFGILVKRQTGAGMESWQGGREDAAGRKKVLDKGLETRYNSRVRLTERERRRGGGRRNLVGALKKVLDK